MHVPYCQVAEFLLAKGAAINAEDSYGRTPLEDSVLGGHELVAHLLRFNGAKLGKKIRVRREPPPPLPFEVFGTASHKSLVKVCVAKVLQCSACKSRVQHSARVGE